MDWLTCEAFGEMLLLGGSHDPGEMLLLGGSHDPTVKSDIQRTDSAPSSNLPSCEVIVSRTIDSRD